MGNNNTNNKNKMPARVKVGIAVVVISGILGAIVGFVHGFFDEANIDFSAGFFGKNSNELAVIIAGGVSVVSCIVGSIVSLVLYRQSKALVIKSRTDDNLLDKAEKKNDFFTLVSTTSLIITGFSSMIMLLAFFKENLLLQYYMLLPCFLLIFIPAFIILIVLIQKSYEFNRELSPNLNFNVFDMRAMNTAENQSDEAQRLLIYKAAFKAMSVCINIVTFAMVAVFVLSILFELSFVPTLILGLVTVLLNFVFMFEQYKMCHPKD